MWTRINDKIWGKQTQVRQKILLPFYTCNDVFWGGELPLWHKIN